MGLILSVVGMAGAGKSETVEAFHALRPFELVYFGGVVLEELARRGLPPGEQSERSLRVELRQTHGPAAMALLRKPAIDAARASGADVLIDGLYSYAELKALRAAYGGDLVLVAVHAPRRLREQRLGARPVRPLTPAEISARDASEIETADKAPPIALADHHIVNDGDLSELRRKAAAIAAEFA